MSDLFALPTELWLGMVVCGALFAALLIPYLWEEIRRGKVEFGPGFPTGAGDIHPGYPGNLLPDRPEPEGDPYGTSAVLSLRAFHQFLIALSIVLASGLGVWGLFNGYIVLGALSLGLAPLLVVYGSYFVWKADNLHLE